MRTLFVAGVASAALIAPALAAALAPKEIHLLYHRGRQDNSRAGRQGRDQGRGHVETLRARLLTWRAADQSGG